jgi:hypothetical protein
MTLVTLENRNTQPIVRNVVQNGGSREISATEINFEEVLTIRRICMKFKNCGNANLQLGGPT